MTTERATTTTILFSDLVGSTEMMQRAGDDDALRIFKAHYQLLRDAVRANGSAAEVKSPRRPPHGRVRVNRRRRTVCRHDALGIAPTRQRRARRDQGRHQPR